MKKFKAPEIEVLELKKADVICTSVAVIVPPPIGDADGETGI